MERNTQHSPRVDDQMKAETESLTRGSPVEARADEFLEKEGIGEDQPRFDTVDRADRDPPSDTAMSADQVLARSELARHVAQAEYPAERESLLEAAREANAPDAVIQQLERLPDGAEFENFQAVWVALGGDVEQRM